MQRSRILRSHLFLVAMSLMGGALLAGACSDEIAPATPAPDGSTDLDSSTTEGQDAPTGSDSSTPVDAGADADEVGDGGGNPIEDDGGTTDLDGGFDAGPACGTVNTGAYSTNTCGTLFKLLGGGIITTTTYELSSVTVVGSKTFCAAGGGYTPYEHRGGLKVTVKSSASATFEFLDQYRKPPKGGIGIITKPTTVRYDVDVAVDGSTSLSYSPTACALKPAPTKVPYNVGQTAGGKKTLTLRLPYGTGSANYFFVEP